MCHISKSCTLRYLDHLPFLTFEICHSVHSAGSGCLDLHSCYTKNTWNMFQSSVCGCASVLFSPRESVPATLWNLNEEVSIIYRY